MYIKGPLSQCKGEQDYKKEKGKDAHERLKRLATVQMSITVIRYKLTEMMATHLATTIPNIVLSNYHMINTKDQCPSNVIVSTL